VGLLDYLDTSRRQLGLLGDAEFPVGDIPIMPGVVLNDLLRPFTDSRGDGNMLPPGTTLNRIGRGMEALSPANVANAHIDAINGQTAEGQPVEGFARLMGLFPAAGAEGGGLLAPAVEKGATTIGTYAGIKSATADLKALAKAKRMEKAGESAKPDGRIRQVTGWFKDPSGDWQYEISDLNARVDPHPTDPDRYMFTHPELDAAYPGSTNMPIHRLNRDSDSLGWYQNPGVTSSGPEAGIRAGLTDAEKRSVALHEIGGHHVQDREGFARGSTPSKNVARSQELTQPFFDEANRRIAAGEMTEDQAMDWLREATKGKTADDLYRANLGEYAARDIQARADYPDWKRQAVPPYSSEPTPPGGWIDNRGASKGERSAMAEPPPPDIPILSTDQPTPPNARVPQGLDLGDIYPDAIAAGRAWTAAGGKQSGLKVAPVGDGTYTHIPDPNFQPGPGPVAPAPQGYGGVGSGMGPPSIEPVPPTGYMDRRGGLRRSPLGPRNPSGLVDPEGRPLYQDATIAGQRTPGGPDVPLSIREEIDLNNRLTGGDMSFPMGIPGAKGSVVVKQPGTVNPPTPPLLKMEIDQNRDAQTYQNTTRHEGGHAIDYWTERTERGSGRGQRQHPIPDDVRRELTSNSQEMRPEHWDPHAPSKSSISEPYLHEYRNRPDELIADGYRAYKEDPAGFKAKYPEAAKYIRAMVNDDPLLSQHVQFNVMGGGSNGLLTSPIHDDERKR
jgi:hypothetical protein